jgi:hypothetical protein
MDVSHGNFSSSFVVNTKKSLRVTIRTCALSRREEYYEKKASWPPKGYLKFPLEASHRQFLGSPLHDILQTEADAI